MMRIICLLFTVLMLPSRCLAQGRMELRVSEIIPVKGQAAGPLSEPLKCDTAGNLFFQLIIDLDHPHQSPVLRVSPDGRQVKQFSLAQVKGLKDGYLVDFAPAPTGELHLLVNDNTDAFYVVTFRHDGSSSTVKLRSTIQAFQIAPLASGDFLIAGRETERNGGAVRIGDAYISVFDSRGAEVRQIPIADDLPPVGYDARNRAYDKAIALSMTDRSDSGTVYLMRYAPTGPVHTFSPQGALLRTIWPPIPHEGAYLFSIKSRGDQFVTEFIRRINPTTLNESADVTLFVWDVNSGKKVAEYHESSPVLGAALGCYKPDVFTFVGITPEHTLQIVRATPARLEE